MSLSFLNLWFKSFYRIISSSSILSLRSLLSVFISHPLLTIRLLLQNLLLTAGLFSLTILPESVIQWFLQTNKLMGGWNQAPETFGAPLY